VAREYTKNSNPIT